MKIYLEESFGVSEPFHSEQEMTKQLPLYLRGSYNFFSSYLNGQKVLWAELKNPDQATPEQLKKQSHVLQEVAGKLPIIYVFENLEPWQRKRLIEKKVGFAEPFRQLYVPSLFIQLRDGHGPEKTISLPVHQLKPPAQLLLLYHLQVKTLEGLPLQEIAKMLNYSGMTITRAIRELNTISLLRVEGKKEKSIFFNSQRKDLWEKALPYLASPTREIWYQDQSISNEYTRLGGETALSHFSMLSPPDEETTVIGKDAFRLIKNQFKRPDRKYGFYRIEVWHYDPVQLSNHVEADKLSLYLTLKNHDDERIRGALKHMINEMIW
ncbi:MAG: hypothetical protein KF862_10480 [Chitinophagaceae bacterium]|nr:hypothetical protein [Chitinophagaceae bacterium]